MSISNGTSVVSIKDSPNLDAFSRLRISNPQSLFSVQCQYTKADIIMESGNTGTGEFPSHSINNRMVKLSAIEGTGTCFFQSFQYMPYQPGKSHDIKITGLLDTPVESAVVDVGYFDASNGIIYRQDGINGLQFIRRTSTSGSVVDNIVNQSEWNLDKLNGSGISLMTIDQTKVFILVIDLQFLAMGRVRIGFDIGGVVVYAHEFLNANILTVPYMQTATLPVAMVLTATLISVTKNCYFKCAAVNSEGGISDDFAYNFSTPEIVVTAGSATRTHLMSIRPKNTFNSITNRVKFELDFINILVTGTNPIYWELCIGQAITSPLYSDVNALYSSFEYGTGVISGSASVVIASGYSQGAGVGTGSPSPINRSLLNKYPITLDRDGNVRSLGTLTLVVTGIGGASVTRASMGYREIR